MKKIQFILTLALLLIASGAGAAINGQWKMHPTFDNSVTRVIDTPTRTYFMGLNQTYNENVGAKRSTDQSLFYYDKEGDEIISAFRNHPLSSPAVDKIEYNAQKRYLLILYKNQDIDLFYDNGEIVNIPALLHADIPGARQVNSISFYPWNNSIWIATGFGYVVINDEKYEVSDSRNYGVDIAAACQSGDKVVLATKYTTYEAPVADKRLSMSDYKRSDISQGAINLLPISENKVICVSVNEADKSAPNIFTLVEADGDALNVLSKTNPSGKVSICPSEKGYNVLIGAQFIIFDREKNDISYGIIPVEDRNIQTCASWDQKEFFTVLPRKGLRSIKLEGGKSVLTRDFRLPNAPNAYWSRAMAYHPRYGMLVTSHGPELIFENSGLNNIREPHLLSGLKNGEWTPLSAAYRNPAQLWVGNDPQGLVIDPADDRYVYSGSYFSGFTRLNLDDPNDVLHYTHAKDETASLPGYVETYPTQGWARFCAFMAPKFDSNNTLWSLFPVFEGQDLVIRYLTDADRRASKDASTARPWKEIIVPGIAPNQYSLSLPLTSSFNKNLFLFMDADQILIYNTAGTLDNTSDDTKAHVRAKIFDQDGGEVNLFGANCAYEDPATGFVWFGTDSGVFYLQPQNMLRGQTNVSRIKVARNDGTSLADYLLNGVGVRAIVTDSQGRKWFASGGAGIVVTSADGKTVLGEFTESNSDIPSNNIYNLCYNPSTNSMMVSTEKGLAEFFIGASGSSDNSSDEVRAFPNPVAPDYHGWVTIDGLPENSLVKIVDASGNLVRELGRAESGSIQWDVMSYNNRRVNTGVYYVLSSPGTGTGASNVAKILVMN